MTPVFDKNGLATEPGNIRCFYFDRITLEYTGWSDEYIHVGVSMPGNSTGLEPGENELGTVQIYTGSSWEKKEDHRGKESYSMVDREEQIIDYIGLVRDGWTLSKPLTNYDKWDGTKWVTDSDAQKAAQVAETTNRKAALIAEATVMIAPLQDAKDGGYIDDEDIPVLTAWQKYRYALTKVDPANPSWPERPGQ